MLFGVIARVPKAGRTDFERYEDLVLALLGDHGGRLERRLRTADGATELHLVAFPSPEAFAAYRDDPRRREHAPLLERSGASIELIELEDVP